VQRCSIGAALPRFRRVRILRKLSSMDHGPRRTASHAIAMKSVVKTFGFFGEYDRNAGAATGRLPWPAHQTTTLTDLSPMVELSGSLARHSRNPAIPDAPYRGEAKRLCRRV
jgi:hypothetical protein